MFIRFPCYVALNGKEKIDAFEMKNDLVDTIKKLFIWLK